MNSLKKYRNKHFLVRDSRNWGIHVDSKSFLDNYVKPPDIEVIPHIIKNQPRNFTTVDLEFVCDHIMKLLNNYDSIFLELSPKVLNELTSAIKVKYFSINYLDLNQNGNGLIIPTFIELLHDCLFWVKEKKIDLTESDKRFISKYQWTFNFKKELINKKPA